MARSCSLTLIAAATWRVALGVQRHASPVAQQEHEVLASKGACPVPQWASSENVVIFEGYCYATRSFKDPMNEDSNSKPEEQNEETFADGWQLATYSDELADFLTQYPWGSLGMNLKNPDDVENCLQVCTKAMIELQDKGVSWANCKTEGTFKHIYDGRTAQDCGIVSNRPHASSTKTALIMTHKATATAVGDPHLVNTRGERFSIFVSGQMEFIRVPYESTTEKADFTVHATIQSFGDTDKCKQAQYITGLLFGGSWFKGKPLEVNVDFIHSGATRKEMKILLGGVPVTPSTDPIKLGDRMALQLDDSSNFLLKVGEASVAVNLQYYFLNVEANAFTKLAQKIGGLLGEDDHAVFSMKPDGCQREFLTNAAPAVYSSARMTQ